MQPAQQQHNVEFVERNGSYSCRSGYPGAVNRQLLAACHRCQAGRPSLVGAVSEVKPSAKQPKQSIEAVHRCLAWIYVHSRQVQRTSCCRPISVGLGSAANHAVLTDGTRLGITGCSKQLGKGIREIWWSSAKQQAFAVDSSCQDGEHSKLGARAMGGGA